jgi:hypothetical protein
MNDWIFCVLVFVAIELAVAVFFIARIVGFLIGRWG